jgi:dihydrodipicolinate synthase/N-acetylneuraminate lyase
MMAMAPGELRSMLRGPLAFPVTPFDPHLAVDFDALRVNVRALLEHRPAAIVAAGGTG